RRARAERDHPLRIGDLLVDALEHGALALADGAHHPEQIGLPRGEARRLGAEAREAVVHRPIERHEFHAAAGGDEGVLKERVLPRPREEILELRRDEARVDAAHEVLHRSHSSAPFRHAYTSVIARTATKITISTSPNQPRSRKVAAHGYMNTASMSKTTKRIAVR